MDPGRPGKDYAKPGYLMLKNPQEGDLYRQEFALGDAEDVAEVISRGVDHVPGRFRRTL